MISDQMGYKKPINVLYVLNATGGGASLGIYEMLRALPRDRYRAFAVAPPDCGKDRLEKLRPIFDDIRLFHIPWWNVNDNLDIARRLAIAASRLKNGISVNRATVETIKAIRAWNIDLVHTGTSLTINGALAARETGVRHIWHIKECIGQHNRVHFRAPDNKLVKHMSTLSSRVVAMSEHVADVFRSNGCANLDVLPDGVDLQPYIGGESRFLRERLGLNENEKLVGMVASLTSSWKRHDVYIRMVGHLARQEPNVRFVIIGPKPGANRWPYDHSTSYYKRLMRLTSDCVPDGRLTFLDFVPDPADIMRSLDVLVHPCEIEPFGRIAIEAMAAGRPVVGPLTGGIAETVVDGETGFLVAGGSPKEFAEATRTLLRDDSLCKRFGEAGRVRAQACYSLERHVQAQCQIYEQALGRAMAIN